VLKKVTSCIPDNLSAKTIKNRKKSACHSAALLDSNTNYTRELGVSIMNFVEYLGVFVLKKSPARCIYCKISFNTKAQSEHKVHNKIKKNQQPGIELSRNTTFTVLR